MSDHATHAYDDAEDWQPPDTFREGLADVERLAAEMVAALGEPSLLVPTQRLEFIARRVHRLAREAHAALPPEVI